MLCKICNNDNVIKAGISHGKQRYKCKDCAVHFVKHYKRLSERDRLRAVRFCTYGMSVNTVAKMFFITTTSIARWVKWDKKHPNKKQLSLNDTDHSFARLWINSSNKYFKRHHVLRFQFTHVKEMLENYQNVKREKNNLGNYNFEFFF